MRLHSRSRQGLALLGGIALVWPLVLGQGCPSTLFPSSSTGVPLIVVQAPSINQDVAIGNTITMVYDATAAVGTPTVSAFYDRDGLPDTGDEVFFAQGLSAGTNRFTQLSTSGLTAGNLFVGITAVNSIGTTTVYASGVIRLVASANILFSSPSGSMTVGAGVRIPVQFSAGQPNFTYQLFYLYNGRTTTISQGTSGTGSSVSVTTTFDTTGLPAGQYQLGATVTTATGSQTTGYATGTITIVLGSFVQVLIPNVGTIAVPGEFVEIVLAANDPNNPNTQVRVFYDPDTTYNNGNEVTIDTISQSDGGTSWDTTDVAVGSYYVGAALLNGQTTPPVSYSTGPVEITLDGQGGTSVYTISVRAPGGDITVMEKSDYTIKWVTSVAAKTGTVTLYYDTDLNSDHVADGTPVEIVAGLDASLGQYVWTLPDDLLDTLFIIAKLIMPDGTTAQATSRGQIIIRQQLSWIGNVGASNSRTIPGVVMRGFNFNDFAGSTFTPVSDIDGDGYDDFVVVAQFGKPKLNNPDGAGLGEAYLIYGDRELNAGPVDLNTTGELDEDGELKGLNGVIIPGINTKPVAPATTVSGTDIVGLPSVMPVRDQDDDDRPELVVGYPRANSARGRTLGKQGQFLRGGIVMISSRNTRIKDQDSRDINGSRVLELAQVGQNFTSYEATLFETQERWRCYPGYDDDGNLECDSCDSSHTPLGYDSVASYPNCEGDNCTESIIDGGVGFEPSLVEELADGLEGGNGFQTWANNGCTYPTRRDAAYYGWAGLVAGIPNDWFQIRGTTCGHATGLPVIDSNGATTGSAYLSSGFYTGASAEPFGMRLLGRASGDAFGQSMAVVDDRLLIGAPLRTAVINEIANLNTARAESGVVYEIKIKASTNTMTSLYGYTDRLNGSVEVDPRPHQYIAVEGGNCGGNQGPTDAFTIVGARANEQIGSFVSGVADFNGDLKGDILIGSPNAFSIADGFNDSGAVYLIYRRTTTAIEGDYDLGKIELDPADRSRLHGFLIRGRANERIGYALAPGFDLNGDTVAEQFDFNQDDLPDIVIGNQSYNSQQGEIIVLFGSHELVSPANGYTVEDLVTENLAAIIQGENAGDLAGYNVAYAGDFDGDDIPDLLISAPNASPEVDTNNDGVKETLTNAGLVYLLFGSNKLVAGQTYNLSDIRTGTLSGLIFAGRSTGDHLGGGEVASQVDDPVYGFGLLGMRARSLSWAGDINKDGYSDILIGSPMASPYGKINAGEVYLIYGFKP